MKVYYWSMSSDCPNARFAGWEVIKEKLPRIKVVSSAENADAIVAYLCALTKDEIAGAKDALQNLISEKKRRPKVKLFVGGCLPEIKNGTKHYPEIFRLLDSPEIDLKFGRKTMAEDILRYFEIAYERETATSYMNGDSACIQITSGCNRKCSFCKCHYLDMPFQSVPVDEVKYRIECAIKKGATRLNIAGENITEYGMDLGAGNTRLLGLLKEIAKYPNIKLIDLCGITLDEIDSKLLEFLMREPKIGIIQVEAQSFIPEVRKAMNLSKSADEAMRIIAELASKKPIISNVMIGHPGENEKGFRQQYNFIKRKKLFMMEPNIYINTPGTKSYLMQQIPEALVHKRFCDMLALTYALRRECATTMCAQKVTARALVSKSGKLILMPVNKPVIIEADTQKSLAVGDRVECVVDGLLHSGEKMSFFGEPTSLFDLRDNRIHLRGHLV